MADILAVLLSFSRYIPEWYFKLGSNRILQLYLQFIVHDTSHVGAMTCSLRYCHCREMKHVNKVMLQGRRVPLRHFLRLFLLHGMLGTISWNF
jgi:hypothetical protein